MRPHLAASCLTLLSIATGCFAGGLEINSNDEAPVLEGAWEVCSAGYQLAGPIYYTFRGNTLTIESRQAEEKRFGAPRKISITHWRFEIDKSRKPYRLDMHRLDRPDIKEVQAFEVRDGVVWMCKDRGDPITADFFQPGKNGWLTGLSRRK